MRRRILPGTLAVLALLTCRGAPPSPAEVEEQLARGERLEREGETDSALDAYALAASGAREIPNAPLLRARSLNRLGALLVRQGETDEAKPPLEEALESARAAGDGAQAAEALFQLGSVQYSLGRMRDAERWFEESARAAAGAAHRGLESRALLYVGMAAKNMEHLERAEAALEKAAELSRLAGDARGEAEAIRVLGQTYSQLGENQKALENFERARSLLEPLDDEAAEAAILNAIGQVHFDMGETETALGYYRRALETNRALGIPRREAATLLEVGRCELDLGRPEEALRRFEEALGICRELGNARLEADVLAELGRLHVREGDDREALGYFESAIELKRTVGDRGVQAYILIEAGEAHRRLGSYEQALRLFREAAELSHAASDPLLESQALYHRALAYRDEGKLEPARREVEESIRLTETLRAQVASHALRTSFFRAAHERFSLYIDLLLSLHREHPSDGLAELAFQVAERGRARTLQESLLEAAAGIREGVDPELLAREQALRARINELAIEAQLVEPQEAAGHAKDLEEAAREYDRLQSRIRSLSPRYAELTDPPAATLDVARSYLDADTRLLSYHLGAERSVLWSIGRNGHEVHVLPPRDEIETLARDAQLLLQSPAGSRLAYREDSAVVRLSRLLLEPVAGVSEKRIVVVAGGALSYVPFAALVDPRAPDEPLVASREIVRLPSASIVPVLRRQRGNREFERWLAIAADPQYGADYPRLAASAREAKEIAALAPPGTVDVVTGLEASRAWVESTDFSKYRAVHFAAHGIVDDDRPELSGIALSLSDREGDPVNGFLRLHDVYNLRLPVDLVVLSACESGLGKEVRGEGLIGLVRGFLYAGASAVIASSWKVDDRATAELMVAFYRRLFEGDPPAAALRKAQESLWRSSRFRDPYYWAAFELQGDWQ